MDKTSHSFAIVTDCKKLIIDIFGENERILIDEVNRNDLKIRIPIDSKESHSSDFNFNLKYLCLRQLLDKEDAYIVWTDCDNSLEWWDEDVIQSYFKETLDNGFNFLGCRMLYTWECFIEEYKTKNNKEHGIFWHKIFNYDLDVENKDWYHAPLPAEHIIVFLETGDKLKKYYDQFKWFHDHLVEKGFCYGTWAEGFEMGVAGYIAGYKPCDIGWSHPILSKAIKYNGHAVGHPTDNGQNTNITIIDIKEEKKSNMEFELTEFPKVTLSLTTTPNRLSETRDGWGIKPCINNLLNLTYSNYEIHFNIPYVNHKTSEEYIIPEWLTELSINNDKLKLFRCNDFGSITKIVPTLKRIDDPESIIITVDDDILYTDGFIEYHLKKQQIYPDTVLGFAGIGALDGTCHLCTTLSKDTQVKIIEGYKTVSYKRKFFKDDFFNEFVGKSWCDDLLISAHMGKHKIPKIVMNYYKDNDFQSRVESFPIISVLPNEQSGCYLYRIDNVDNNNEEFYKKGYL